MLTEIDATHLLDLITNICVGLTFLTLFCSIWLVMIAGNKAINRMAGWRIWLLTLQIPIVLDFGLREVRVVSPLRFAWVIGITSGVVLGRFLATVYLKQQNKNSSSNYHRRRRHASNSSSREQDRSYDESQAEKARARLLGLSRGEDVSVRPRQGNKIRKFRR